MSAREIKKFYYGEIFLDEIKLIMERVIAANSSITVQFVTPSSFAKNANSRLEAMARRIGSPTVTTVSQLDDVQEWGSATGPGLDVIGTAESLDFAFRFNRGYFYLTQSFDYEIPDLSLRNVIEPIYSALLNTRESIWYRHYGEIVMLVSGTVVAALLTVACLRMESEALCIAGAVVFGTSFGLAYLVRAFKPLPAHLRYKSNAAFYLKKLRRAKSLQAVLGPLGGKILSKMLR